ncbi:hypothetical protein [Phenylobacterium sp.]|uniref:hypothetical protein n=1 Tax=Phenylobacterium sp. TaxID=1871053 RepID=UPI0028121F0E|nr:hypothetical protein [Phenylobacterium sp.]
MMSWTARSRRRRYPWQQRDDSFSAEDERDTWGLTNALDGLLGFPLLLYFGALITKDQAFEWAPYVGWLLAVVVWTPVIVFRVAGRAGDKRRASAVLAHGLLLWPLVAPVAGFGGRVGLLLFFPVLYAWGGVAMLLAGRAKPPQRSARSYAWLLQTGAAIYGLIALGLAALGLLSLGSGLGFFGFIVAFGLAAPAALAAVKLVERGREPPPTAST